MYNIIPKQNLNHKAGITQFRHDDVTVIQDRTLLVLTVIESKFAAVKFWHIKKRHLLVIIFMFFLFHHYFSLLIKHN